MQKTRANLDRRTFLKLGASGLAAAGLLPEAIAEQGPTGEGVATPVVLRSSLLEVHLDPATGLPLVYRLARSGVRFKGSWAALNMRLYRREPWEFAEVIVRPNGNKVSNAHADFQFTAMYTAEKKMLLLQSSRCATHLQGLARFG